MNRRNFSQKLALAGLATLGFALPAAAEQPRKQPRRRTTAGPSLIKPRALKRGDLVGLIAPSGATDAAFVEQRVKNLEAFGFSVKVSKNILATRGNTAGTVSERVADIHDMFNDRNIKGIWAVRGGSGASQLLPAINYGLIRRNPKILVGYSDVTALHLALLRYAGLITFHGPVASADFTDYAATQLEAVLMRPRAQTTIYMSAANEIRAATSPEFQLRTIKQGIAEGRLIGGNLSVLAALIGTPYAADIRDAILFLEDVGEAPYRIDRMLTQLEQSAPLSTVRGVMLGVFSKVVAAANEASLTLQQTLDDHFAALDIPSIVGFSFGHIANQFTIPVGVRARLDTENQTLTLLESAVLG